MPLYKSISSRLNRLKQVTMRKCASFLGEGREQWQSIDRVACHKKWANKNRENDSGRAINGKRAIGQPNELARVLKGRRSCCLLPAALIVDDAGRSDSGPGRKHGPPGAQKAAQTIVAGALFASAAAGAPQ